jgi:hypothetical protein
LTGSRPTPRSAAPLTGLILACALALIALSLPAGRSAEARSATRAHAASPRAHAAKHLWIGVSDNSVALFRDPRFRWLGTHLARLVVPWNVVARPRELAWDTAWLQAALAQRVRPLVAFNADPSHPNRLPSVSAYGAAVDAFMGMFPWVRDYSPWNEENHERQPTGRDPHRAAQYFNLLSAHCRSCMITAADVLDTPNMGAWVRSFLHWAHRPRLWGLHSYVDVGRASHERTSELLRMVHGEVWFTEAGGPVWRWERPYGVARATYIVHPESYAETLVHRLLALAAISPRITRIYYYQWRVDQTLDWARRHGQLSWDSGLLRPDCSTRPAFFVVARAAGRVPSRVPRARRNHSGDCV